ncbi:MAG: hypothetical protein HQK54_12770 [Oligoflexales bacterium]|nr:hypothetical protein [Oligoflexales bacterium]
MNDEYEDEDDIGGELIPALKILLESGIVAKESEKKIIKKVIEDGIDSLSPKQSEIFEIDIMSLFPSECDNCGAPFDDLSEAAEAINEEGLCLACIEESMDSEEE